MDLKFGYGKPTPDPLDWARYLALVGWRAYFTGGTPAKHIMLLSGERLRL